MSAYLLIDQRGAAYRQVEFSDGRMRLLKVLGTPTYADQRGNGTGTTLFATPSDARRAITQEAAFRDKNPEVWPREAVQAWVESLRLLRVQGVQP